MKGIFKFVEMSKVLVKGKIITTLQTWVESFKNPLGWRNFCMKAFWHWLIIYWFTSHSRFFHQDITIISEGLQNLGQCSAYWAFEQGGRNIYCATSAVFLVSSKEPPHSVASYNTQRGCGGSILTHGILTGQLSNIVQI
jgi:hypothetical protein